MRRALRKASKSLAVGVEVVGCSVEHAKALSPQLRDANVAAIWTADLEATSAFTADQAPAKGEYPGPVPVVFSGAP